MANDTKANTEEEIKTMFRTITNIMEGTVDAKAVICAVINANGDVSLMAKTTKKGSLVDLAMLAKTTKDFVFEKIQKKYPLEKEYAENIRQLEEEDKRLDKLNL